jgi:hypothetical protein
MKPASDLTDEELLRKCGVTWDINVIGNTITVTSIDGEGLSFFANGDGHTTTKDVKNMLLRPLADPARIRALLESREREAVREALGGATSFPIPAILDRLVDAAEHYLHKHSCDRHGYEIDIAAVKQAKAAAARLRKIAEWEPIEFRELAKEEGHE